MSIKNGFNLVFFVFIAILFSIFSCTAPLARPQKGDLMKADNDFSELSSKEGMYRSFISFAADSAVLLRDNSFPVTGRNSLVDLFAGKSDTSFLLVWEPLFEKISSSGDIGAYLFKQGFPYKQK